MFLCGCTTWLSLLLDYENYDLLSILSSSSPLNCQRMSNNFFNLQADLMKYFREDLHRRLLSTDFKKQVDGLELLQKVYLVYYSLAEIC